MPVNKDGYPRLPFNKFWPDQAQLDALIRRARDANGDPLSALQSVLRLVYSYQALQGQNAAYESRLWGQTDVSEHTAEHWNYLRNSDFTQGATGLYKWLATSVTAVTGTTGLPYGVRKAIQGTNNNVTADRFIAQSVSANGNTWWCYGGWVKPASGAYAGFAVVENSGSASGRTHASFIPGDGNWRYLPDHQVSTREFRTYKGTTRMVFRCAIKGNAIAQFARVMLEQGRRPHPWRPNILDRGNYITSIKTAGSASFYGNVLLSASGGAAIRQKAIKTFIFGTRYGTATPIPVSTSGTIGTATTLARSDHRHRGVKALKYGGVSRAGTVAVSGSGTGAGLAWSGQKLKVGFPKPATTAPVNPSTSATVGTGTTWMRVDARARAVRSIRTAGSASFAASIVLSSSGTGTIRQVAGPPRKFVFPIPPAATAAPVNPSTSATVGTSGRYMRQDARLRGVRSMRTAGSASFSASIVISASGSAAIRQVAGPPRKFVFPFPSASGATPTPVSTSGTVGTTGLYARQAHRHRGVKAVKYGGVSNAGTVAISGSGTGWGLAWSASKLKVGFPKPATATPAAPSTSGTVGTGTLWARTDHRHRGLKSLRTPGSASFAGSIVISASTNAAVRQVAGPPRKFIFGATGGGAGTEKAANAALRWLHLG